MKKSTHCLYIDSSGENIVSETVLQHEEHALTTISDRENGDIYLNFSSREAMYDFARSLLHEAVFGVSGQKEFYPLRFKDKQMVVEGARLTPDSSRVFVKYPIKDK